jgi:hypothetical protein
MEMITVGDGKVYSSREDTGPDAVEYEYVEDLVTR